MIVQGGEINGVYPCLQYGKVPFYPIQKINSLFFPDNFCINIAPLRGPSPGRELRSNTARSVGRTRLPNLGDPDHGLHVGLEQALSQQRSYTRELSWSS